MIIYYSKHFNIFFFNYIPLEKGANNGRNAKSKSNIRIKIVNYLNLTNHHYFLFFSHKKNYIFYY